MTKRPRIALAFLLVVALGGVAWQALRQREPIYQGKPLSFWLKGFQLDDWPGKPGFDQTCEAVRETGTNSFPILLHMFRARDSDLKRNVISFGRKAARQGFFALGKNAKYAVPALVEIYEERTAQSELKSHCLGYIAEILESVKDEDIDASEDVVKALKRILAQRHR
jgi:hypothetical protein